MSHLINNNHNNAVLYSPQLNLYIYVFIYNTYVININIYTFMYIFSYRCNDLLSTNVMNLESSSQDDHPYRDIGTYYLSPLKLFRGI